jgi:hypothetical protein
MKTATPADWKTTPMPEARRAVDFTRTFRPHEVAKLRRGRIPEQMEDKWFVYWRDAEEGSATDGSAELFFHRSWTGLCVFIVTVVVDDDGGGRATRAVANGDVEQYRGSEESDRSLVGQLIDGLLARR